MEDNKVEDMMSKLGKAKAEKVGGSRQNRRRYASGGSSQDKEKMSDEEVTVGTTNAASDIIADMERVMPKKEIREQAAIKPQKLNVVPKNDFQRNPSQKPLFQPQKQYDNLKNL
uniref:Uncharacterized protein n=1 Tax=Arion vulgaris TaxID=1028688 RepID=A0A0B6ZPI4_9EUPU